MTITLLTFLPAILIGIAAGLTPGPILMAGSTAIFQFSDGLKKAISYCLLAGCTEIFFALILFFGAGKFLLPFVPFLQILGGILLIFFAYKVFLGIKNFHLVEKNKKIFSTKEIMLMLFLNGELILFYITVLFPFIFEAQKIFLGGGILFIFLFISTVTLTMIGILFAISLLKKKFESTKIFQFFPYIILIFFLFLGLKILYSGIQNFIPHCF